MTLFGYSIPLWIILSVAFAGLYILFTVLSSVREKRIKAKRKENNVEHDI